MSYVGRFHNPSGSELRILSDGNGGKYLDVPGYSKPGSFYADYRDNPTELFTDLQFNKEMLEVSRIIKACESVSSQELIDAGYNPLVVARFFPKEPEQQES